MWFLFLYEVVCGFFFVMRFYVISVMRFYVVSFPL